MRSLRFPVIRIMNVDDQGGGRPRSEVNPLDGGGTSRTTADLGSERSLVADALALLSAELRAVVLRSYYQGATTAQIAADLRIPEDTVKSRLHFALRDLRRSLHAMGLA